jgi:hypothetical protein
MPVSEPSSVDRWTVIRRRDWPGDGGATIIKPGAPVPEPDDDLEVIEVVPVAEIERLREEYGRVDRALTQRNIEAERLRSALRSAHHAIHTAKAAMPEGASLDLLEAADDAATWALNAS